MKGDKLKLHIAELKHKHHNMELELHELMHNPGGVAIILANWLHVSGQPWRDRVTSWVSGLGVQAWIVQREVQDPAQYVAMWLRDAAAEGAPLAHDQYAEWLAEFEALNAQAVGFGWIVLRNSGSELITVDDHSHAPRLPRGDEVIAALDLQQLVEQMDAFAMLNTVLLPVQGLVVRSEAHRAGSTWMPGLHRLVQAGSWRAPVETDDIGARVVHACDGQRTLGQILDDLAQETGLEVDEVLAGGLLTARALLAEGLLVPQLPARI